MEWQCSWTCFITHWTKSWKIHLFSSKDIKLKHAQTPKTIILFFFMFGFYVFSKAQVCHNPTNIGKCRQSVCIYYCHKYMCIRHRSNIACLFKPSISWLTSIQELFCLINFVLFLKIHNKLEKLFQVEYVKILGISLLLQVRSF